MGPQQGRLLGCVEVGQGLAQGAVDPGGGQARLKGGYGLSVAFWEGGGA